MRFCLIIIYVLIAALSVFSCANNYKRVTEDSHLISSIEQLSVQADTCLATESKTSNACVNFFKLYRTGGADAVKQLSANAASYLEKDLDAALNTTEQIIIISNAVLFLAQ